MADYMREDCVVEILESIPTAAALISSKAMVINSNKLFRKLINNDNGITKIEGRIVVSQPAEHRKFCRLVKLQIQQTIAPAASYIRVAKRSDNDFYYMKVFLPSALSGYKFLQCPDAVMVMIIDFLSLPKANQDMLMNIYNLTMSEATRK